MKEITETVSVYEPCRNPDHWYNVIAEGFCHTCQKPPYEAAWEAKNAIQVERDEEAKAE